MKEAKLLEISNPTSEDAETVRLLVLAERAKHILRGKMVYKFFEYEVFIVKVYKKMFQLNCTYSNIILIFQKVKNL